MASPVEAQRQTPMSRLKLQRFKVKPPPPDVAARYLRDYPGDVLYRAPQSFPPISGLELFGNDRPLVFDLGCGRGEFLIAQALERPDENFVGFDWHRKSAWDAVNRAWRAGLENVRVIRADLRMALGLVPDGAAYEAYMLFPPPVVRPSRRSADALSEETLRQIRRVLITGGAFHFVTDHPGYFAAKRALIEATGLFAVQSESQAFEGGLTRFQRFWEGFDIASRRLECRAI